jgi:plasmid stabilization system protein ParE
MTYRLSPQAKSELEAIGDYIAADSPANAKRFIDRLTENLLPWGAALA